VIAGDDELEQYGKAILELCPDAKQAGIENGMGPLVAWASVTKQSPKAMVFVINLFVKTLKCSLAQAYNQVERHLNNKNGQHRE
jgi:hypothetical protein